MPKAESNRYRTGGVLFALKRGHREFAKGRERWWLSPSGIDVRAQVTRDVIRSPLVEAGADGLFGTALSQTYRHNGESHE
jgi:hypothetical protein